MNATKRPWIVRKGRPTFPHIIRKGDEHGVCIAAVQTDQLGYDEGLANAALIVAAVNSHEKLVEALRAIIDANDLPSGATTGEAKVCEFLAKNARRALALATGREVSHV